MVTVYHQTREALARSGAAAAANPYVVNINKIAMRSNPRYADGETRFLFSSQQFCLYIYILDRVQA